MPFKFKRLEIPEVILVEAKQFSDDRGYFEELYKQSEFKEYIPCNFVQINHSFSKKGVLRGLHFQIKPIPQGKLVTVISGKIFDVAVDLRKGSPYYKKWVYAELTPGKLLWIPVGFAHGFLALEDSHVVYLVTREFAKEYDSGIRYDDPEVGVKWYKVENFILSEKDKNLPLLKDSNANFNYGDDLC
ncbi:dTDP-4-dehydrorhamnose 3,5-epimerase [Sulfolobus sp. A20]|uniref:dTDP-4-dehydrorhamnose 3,5-epimerase n=1 Tax=Sulfolobaceae TaxID=118883 RepID=UPI000845D368|nr:MULTISPECIES: dTDP-4-dehydrorhamnose 3,5-epimerase [unclassified Sulfolobus]TRM76105.1 dTDP-4-dehydrorhamnose 3,5-epimerase [Sulfolobus sp. E5]TRM78495.1 dTDP-4-dehydrorhamnose 3,5-epimerase [Sulfolobus sp. B5]TRM82499.1 dTDP-4-dehydrorhamnose 3,5-epimerase [Sulfolobus sp. D5]TRM83330.1 dTDP-4-dehydrorhamnose 3,5-epimerase [Sulfolobus sp. A20-N-F6]TRM83852.1 dTDP-4-dehydrorhamnose 3,5-epimerase [Sulfolobus sp. F3]TRM87430.1 dTDP-4-dehydrorhamnose 3,5-epimerase [Sulfolobus sp. C3]TRN02200.